MSRRGGFLFGLEAYDTNPNPNPKFGSTGPVTPRARARKRPPLQEEMLIPTRWHGFSN